jgi:Glycosyl hydrolase family 63 C-terminal domain
MRTQEHSRLSEKIQGDVPHWHKWGPYVSERAWGTVREDYSWNGDAWKYFPFDAAASKVYRWGEDAIAGWCDRYQVLVFAPVFWNGQDPILKERLFGLSSSEGNHGEDVKECYFYLDGTPTHSYMKYLYKYPQGAFPYEALRVENGKRGTHDPEYELVDTGIFSENRYFDIFIEYAKASPEDVCIRIEAVNRAESAATLHILPHLWFRNQWAWGDQRQAEPRIRNMSTKTSTLCLFAEDEELLSPQNIPFDYHVGKRYLYGPAGARLLFTNNEDLSEGQKYSKEAFHRFAIHHQDSINPDEVGTKACFHYVYENIPAHGSVVLHLRLTDALMENPLGDVPGIFARRKEEADAFYATIHPKNATTEERLVQRQALAGMLWSKQIYLFDVAVWLGGDNTFHKPPESRHQIRNIHWHHLNSMRILSMPDKWEYPWFAAWDLAIQCISLALVDIAFAKEQLWLLLFDQFQHPNGAIPAYEWEFSDLNPPVIAWAVYQVYEMEKKHTGKGDSDYLNKCFLKLIMNFAWWVNKVDSSGNNVFEGGFLGLDNITLIDRSAPSIKGAVLRQSDGTGWMAMFCLNLMRISLELAKTNATYETMATKFFQHFVYIAHAMKKMGNKNYHLWNEQDHFFYDVLSYPNGQFSEFRVRSLVGLIPLFAVEILDSEEMASLPEFKRNFDWFLRNRQELTHDCVLPVKKGFLLTLVNEDHLREVLQYVWDPKEFRSDYGLRSLSKFHKQNPFYYQEKQVGYEPGESLERIKGGNSNWRGPVWMAPTYLLTLSLKEFARGFGEHVTISVADEKPISLMAMAHSFADRIIGLFTPNLSGVRPVLGEDFPFARDPHWCNYSLFYEFFHAETGKGLGASHQTGWSGLVANFIDEYR